MRVNEKIRNIGDEYFDYFDLREQPRKKSRIDIKETFESIFGLIYGHQTRSQNIQAVISDEMLKKRLFTSAKFAFEPFSEETLMLDCSELSMDMIEVTNENNVTKGSVRCIICIICQRFQKVYLKSNSSAWILANLKKHIIICLKSNQKKNNKRSTPSKKFTTTTSSSKQITTTTPSKQMTPET